MRHIYLDYNASTPTAPEVVSAMQPLLTEGYGNPSSPHWAGVPARRALETARLEVATLLGALPDEVVFTSGGSEANNAALKGVFFAARRRLSAPHLITTAVEHPAVETPCCFLESLGARVTRLPVDTAGLVAPDEVRRAITDDTVLVSVMHANNEVGTIQPIVEIGAITRQQGILLHTDAAQSVGKIPVRVEELGVDLLSVAGHKLYAPKGVGALYIREGVEIEPLLHGAGHEAGRRAGTESALLAVGLGRACRLATELPCEDHLRSVTDRFWRRLHERIRRSHRAQRTSHATSAEHAEREHSRDDRSADPGAVGRCRGLDRLGLPQRHPHDVAGAPGNGSQRRGRARCHEVQRGASDDGRRDRRGRRAAAERALVRECASTARGR